MCDNIPGLFDAEDEIQGLVHARQAPHKLSYIPSP